MSKLIDSLKRRAGRLKLEVSALFYAFRDPGLGLLPKIVIGITVGYALSPVDLIPDFIPVLGYLDDLIIVPALILLAVRLIPDDILAEARRRAEAEPPSLRKNRAAAVVIILIWAAAAAAVLLKIFG